MTVRLPDRGDSATPPGYGRQRYWHHRSRPGDTYMRPGTVHRSFNVCPLVQPSSHRGWGLDLSRCLGPPHHIRPVSVHRILAAGDLNMSFQSTDPFDRRAQTVLDERMRARRPRSGTRSDSRTCKIDTGSKLIYASNQTVSHAIIPLAGADICRYSRGRSAYVADRAVCRMHQAWKSRRKEKIFVLCNAPGG